MPNQVQEEMAEERLTDHEAQYMTIGPSISTITFLRFTGPNPTETIRERLHAVVSANPWLAGTLVKTQGKVYLRFPPTCSKEQVNWLLNPTGRKAAVVHSEMDYMQVCQAVSGSAAEVPKGSACVNKQERLLAVSVLPDSKRLEDTVALIFSLSHAIADGYTYYRLLAMLSSGTAVESLSSVRKHQIVQQGAAAMGAKESAFAYSGSTVFNIVSSMVCGRKPLVESYVCDPMRIEEEKKASTGLVPGVDFVSTNDVICSTFGNAVGARVLLMPLNFRDRLPDFTATDAGNYEGALVFGQEDYANPGLIRKSLQSGPPTFQRSVGQPLPGCCEGMRCRIAMVTNWTFPFFSEVKIEGCKQMLHIPISDVNAVPFDIGVVYRPRAGQLAVTFFVRSVDKKGIKKELPMGDVVQSAEAYYSACPKE